MGVPQDRTTRRLPGGVWSATPTPFTQDLKIDAAALPRLVEHHLRLGVRGLFLAGTCGEGPWMTAQQRRALTRGVVEAANRRLVVSVQVTDNSAARILESIEMASEDGADIAVMAPPYYLLNATPENLLRLYAEVSRASPLPIGIYDRGQAGTVVVPDDVLAALYREPNVVLVKDSSQNPCRRGIALAARDERPELVLLNGDEFNCVEYMQAGYDGLLLGGGIVNGWLAGQIIAAVRQGDFERANRGQARLAEMLWRIYGGKQIRCWLAGLKQLLVEMGIFSTRAHYLNYPLTDDDAQTVRRVLADHAEVLFPSRAHP